MVSEKNFHIEVKVCSNLVRYFMLIVDTFYFVQNMKKKYFEENKSNERFGKCSFFFTSKDPIGLILICIK